ncbi:MAG: hypothetical protein EAZ21_08065 [Betaproteobacteria bacterium]|nr:MAG: hypothetical protein EAZ21_08065 [Betaproteobacteria bacterium]
MMSRPFSATAVIVAAAMSLSGCGSGEDAAVAPTPVVTIAAPVISLLVPQSPNAFPLVNGAFVNNLSRTFEMAPQLKTSVDAQQRTYIHLNTFTEAGGAANEARSAAFATLIPGAEFSLGTTSFTHPFSNIVASKSGVSYVSFGANTLYSVLQRPVVPAAITELFRGSEAESVVGPAVGGELFAARLVLNSGSYFLETRSTSNGMWGSTAQTAVTLPIDFTPDRTAGGVRYQLQRFSLRSALSGARGDVFVVSLFGITEPATSFPFSGYGGDYLLWRDRGSNELKTIAYKELCFSPSPRGCLFDMNNIFNDLAIENNGDITYLSDQIDSNSPLFGSRWFRASSTPQQLWLSPFAVGQASVSLRRKDRFDFALATDGTIRSWATNGNEVVLLEGLQGATPAPAAWASANGERSACREFVRCRVLRADSADRLAYLAWDKAARRATLFVSDRTSTGAWKNVAFRDVSELLSELDDTGEIELSAFIAAGAADLVIGATRSGPAQDRVKLFAMNVSSRATN